MKIIYGLRKKTIPYPEIQLISFSHKIRLGTHMPIESSDYSYCWQVSYSYVVDWLCFDFFLFSVIIISTGTDKQWFQNNARTTKNATNEQFCLEPVVR